LRQDLIRTKIKEIEESLELVIENLPDDIGEFTRLGIVKDGIYKRMEFAIENVIDICAVMNTDLDLGIPSSEEGIIANLVKNNVVSKEIGDIVSQMKGFRNFLVHRYGCFDDEIAFESITSGMDDFNQFIEAVETVIEDRS